ncbi:MAG TPA: Rrf2 family transcriptional regulator [Candidatus Acidoferrales bacterium]|nr:Rrf2 family transcriptional regulator [Candidatus Acidoferrales bacterium]
MKVSAQEEYGLRCLLRIGSADQSDGLTIPEISRMEGLTPANVAKLLRILRLGGFIESARGRSGGYKLARSADRIIVGDVLTLLGGKIYEETFCGSHTGAIDVCNHIIDCSMRSLWRSVQSAVNVVLKKITLRDMLGNERVVTELVTALNKEIAESQTA